MTEMTTSLETGKVLPAFVAALHAIEMVPKGETANTGKYVIKYASLAAVLGEVRRACALHDLAVSQCAYIDADAGALKVATTVMHTSGEWVTFPALPFKMPSDAQALGSALTYGKRYSLVSIFAIATEDDDGKAATKPTASRQAPKPKPAGNTPRSTTAKPGGPSERQTKHVMAMFGELGLTDRAVRLKRTSSIVGHDVGSWSDVTADEADQVIDALRRELDKPPRDDIPPHPGEP